MLEAKTYTAEPKRRSRSQIASQVWFLTVHGDDLGESLVRANELKANGLAFKRLKRRLPLASGRNSTQSKSNRFKSVVFNGLRGRFGFDAGDKTKGACRVYSGTRTPIAVNNSCK